MTTQAGKHRLEDLYSRDHLHISKYPHFVVYRRIMDRTTWSRMTRKRITNSHDMRVMIPFAQLRDKIRPPLRFTSMRVTKMGENGVPDRTLVLPNVKVTNLKFTPDSSDVLFEGKAEA